MSPQPFSRAWFEDFAREFFAAVDSMDTTRAMSFLVQEPTCQFGNQPKISGRGQVEKVRGGPCSLLFLMQIISYLAIVCTQLLSDFYQVLHGMSHEIKTIDTDLEHRTIYAGTVVSYVVKGDREEAPISIPVMTLLRFGTAGGGEEMKARDLSVYFDPSSVFEKMSEVQSRA
ncbi:hypothetical protein MBM_03197 [Drepanopeziza brunnea f. sp. 'multigermtubi' MB_m1]|uniref:Uncharacterized protein n=1 Tax=Marssonina brunnea f. sp. multigermtubi (strain MB_m1) TaxID=1072389 RepID=K1WML9_MARBU|nr:uncharacterized protein MBM_03197 [Drepanopeziza brunnea f. sp. 'multigermtubi' MB_m1]EKD18955.1 hypothetical protein MBM_03197 [Drepanopeziza brunnea f. sp. 'multigermtubi' MB_m1]